eukprot:362433-Pyramimonas_sp.AAC.2
MLTAGSTPALQLHYGSEGEPGGLATAAALASKVTFARVRRSRNARVTLSLHSRHTFVTLS